jgi:hypothetical protein
MGGGRRASVLVVPASVAGAEAVAALGLPPPRGLVVLNGGAAPLEDDLEQRLTPLLRDGLARVVVEERLTAITGGTDVGIFAVFGRALAGAPHVVCVGIAPAGPVGWPRDEGRAVDADRVPLEPHHSHFVLVEGEEWGDETEIMLRVAAALEAGCRSVVVLAGGGPIARREVVGHVRAARDVVVLGGSGRFADELAVAVSAEEPPIDVDLAEICESGRVILLPPEARPEDLAELVRGRLLVEASP